MNDLTDQTPSPPSAKSKKDRPVRIGFVIIALAVGGVVWLIQRGGPELSGWNADLDAVLQEARIGNRLVVVFFIAEEKNDAASRMIQEVLPHTMVVKELTRGKYATVRALVDRQLRSGLAVRYELADLPALLILSPAGEVLERRSGFIGPSDLAQMLSQNATAANE